jgi:hypothetical protein
MLNLRPIEIVVSYVQWIEMWFSGVQCDSLLRSTCSNFESRSHRQWVLSHYRE